MDNGNYRTRFDNGIKYILGEEIDSKLNNEIEKLFKYYNSEFLLMVLLNIYKSLKYNFDKKEFRNRTHKGNYILTAIKNEIDKYTRDIKIDFDPFID